MSKVLTKVCKKCEIEMHVNLFPNAKWKLKSGEITVYKRHACIKCCSMEKPRYKRNNELDAETRRKYRATTPEKTRNISRNQSKKYKENLGIGYIKYCLQRSCIPIAAETIDFKKQQLSIKRIVKQLRNEVF